MRFVLFVEGDTERLGLPSFFGRWLDRRSAAGAKVGMKVVTLRGLGVFQTKIKRRAEEYLTGKMSGKTVAAFGLLDLHGLQHGDFFDGAPKAAQSGLPSVESRVRFGTEKMERLVGLERFHMFFAVHEIEAWMLSQPEILAPADKYLGRNVDTPEAINFDNPPSKVLHTAYSRAFKQSYLKTINGPALLEKLDVDIAYEKCPNLARMFDTMADYLS